MKTAAYLRKANEIQELWVCLENISNDDKRDISSYSVKEVVDEAKYVLSTFFESGHMNNDSYIGEYGEDEHKWALSEVRKLKAFIKRFN
jgi:hypothetical protein